MGDGARTQHEGGREGEWGANIYCRNQLFKRFLFNSPLLCGGFQAWKKWGVCVLVLWVLLYC